MVGEGISILKEKFKCILQVDKVDPRRVKSESRGDTIVSLLYAAAAADLSALKTHKV